MPKIVKQQKLLYARLAAKTTMIIAGYFKINPPRFITQVVTFAFELAASSFFPVIILKVFYKRMNKKNAIAGIVTGILFTADYIIYFKFINPAANSSENWLFSISPKRISNIGMLINTIVALLVSKVTPAPPEEVQKIIEDIRIPVNTSGTV